MESILSGTTKASRASISLSLDWDNIFKRSASDILTKRELFAAATLHDRGVVDFCTGSSYFGKWTKLGMDAHGTYTYPYETVYSGGMDDGQFHGKGTIMYPMGQKLECIWNKGKLISYQFCNYDGLEQSGFFTYCKMPDRRFLISISEGLEPAGRERLTNQQPTRGLNPTHYDTGDGFYDPSTRSIIPAREVATLDEEIIELVEEASKDLDFNWVSGLNMPPIDRVEWIRMNCRKGWDEPSGYRPEYYEDWISGRKSEIEQIEQRYKSKKDSEQEGLESDSSKELESEALRLLYQCLANDEDK